MPAAVPQAPDAIAKLLWRSGPESDRSKRD